MQDVAHGLDCLHHVVLSLSEHVGVNGFEAIALEDVTNRLHGLLDCLHK